MRTGAFPGSFNPPTVAHLAIAEAARRQCGLDRVDLILSRVTLGKEDVTRPTPDDRAAVLTEVAATRPWLAVRVVDGGLLADLAHGYDALVLGADKWAQVVDPQWYGGDDGARDDAVARLPPVVACAPRPPHALPDQSTAVVLDLDDEHYAVSSTAVRTDGRHDWLLPKARQAAEEDPERYPGWLTPR